MGSAALALPKFSINILSKAPEELTDKQLEMHGCVISTEATDVLVRKHQVISIHSADLIFIILPNIHTRLLHLLRTIRETEIIFWKKLTQLFKD